MSLKKKILVAIMGAGLVLAGAGAASAAPYQHRMHHVMRHHTVHRHFEHRHVARSERR